MMYNDIDLDSFIKKSEERTLNNEMKWSIGNYSHKNKFLQRSVNYEKVKSIYTNEHSNGDIVAVGNFEKKSFYNEEDYYYEDVYFLSFSDEKSGEIVTFINEASLGFSFQVHLGKLYRIIQLKTNKVAEKLDSWFD